MRRTDIKDWVRYRPNNVKGRDALVDILKYRGLLTDSDPVKQRISMK